MAAAARRDEEYLGRLRDHFAANRRIPSLQHIAALMGFASKAAASKLMQRLANEGFVERAPDAAAWIPGPRFFELPLVVERVRAGAPEMIEATSAQPFLVDQFLVRRPAAALLMPVRGDSMIEAGIHDGDLVVVERGKSANVGDFVIAIVDGEMTLKELARERGRYVLRPHNAAFRVIRPRQHLEIFGVVVALMRRYGS